MHRLILVMALAAAAPAPWAEAPPPPVREPATAGAAAPAPPTRQEQEQFLREADMVKVRGVRKGITGTQQATMSDGTRTHDVSIQAVNESRSNVRLAHGFELQFRDYWGYNVAAARLGAMIALPMVPPSVERRFRGDAAAYTWWVDDVLMDEMQRRKDHRPPPNIVAWNAQQWMMLVFDELIANVDRNQGNMLIDTRWRLWLIDHSRSFRTNATLRNPRALLHCDRKVFERLQTLTRASLQEALGAYLTGWEIDALLKRRDALVARFTALGPRALFDLESVVRRAARPPKASAAPPAGRP
ncbi:hypothetical protein TBR22_A47700 [Luteitalea sp. TBR-22]|uniref:hypothetical protein n=1 Tax=Luteitalea sp. TBR-22 TaxID=2802971 RepID=UPI001AF6C2D8|nr:hypothetical protein [Luteitalea sp. TBR-22]BCS35537.1 hypothetical protein TBR22_A47700 [Luteitalea sp. TBR-22]